MAGYESRTSNALGVPIPVWIINQLEKRSIELTAQNQTNSSKINENIIFRGNRSAWVRMVSSIDVVNPATKNTSTENKAFDYFKNTLGLNIQNQSDLAKLFVLQGGVSKYQSTNQTTFSYSLRNGFKDAYNITGTEREINKYGYRPMPGITSARIQTTGKLGSIKSAEIQLKVWDKEQLDIIDALYFKLGYTMLLEWGHTYYYDSNNGDLKDTESFSINPFEENLTKEDIYNKISNNVRESEGNYDAMLGIVTNFNFTYNQEGGYDCTIKLISLGVLISNMKMNNPRILPDIQEYVIKKLFNTVQEINRQAAEKLRREQEARNPPKNETKEEPKKVKGEEYIRTYLKYDANTNPKSPGGGQISYSAKAPINLNYADFAFHTTGIGWVYYIRRLNGFIPIDDDKVKKSSVQLASSFLNKLNGATLGGKIVDISDGRYWESSERYLKSATVIAAQPISITLAKFGVFLVNSLVNSARGKETFTELDKINDIATINLPYTSTNGLNYNIKIERNLWARSDKKNIVSESNISGDGFLPYTQYAFEYINTDEFVKTLKSVLQKKDNNYQILSVNSTPLNTTVKLLVNLAFYKEVSVYEAEKETVNELSQKVIIPKSIKKEVVPFILPVVIYINDSQFIETFTVPSDVQEPSDFKGIIQGQAKVEPAPAETTESGPSEPPITVLDVQKTETEKYRSAFEVMVRTIQLYSLDAAIKSGIEKDHVIQELPLLKQDVFDEFTKKLFDSGMFANLLGPDSDDNKTSNQDKKAERSDLVYYSRLAKNLDAKIVEKCVQYDEEMRTGTISDKEFMLKIRALFGFHFGLLGNDAKAKDLLDSKCFVDYGTLMKTYTVPYEFNVGIIEGTQLNHPVYLPLGLVIMILNHICTIYNEKKPLVYFDFNHKTNICLSNSKHLSTNPYDILIPFQGTNEDFVSILEPSVIAWAKGNQSNSTVLAIKPTKDKKDGDAEGATPVFTPYNPKKGEEVKKDRISGGLLRFKSDEASEVADTFRGRTMNILISCDYLLRMVGTFTKNNGSGDVYVREFLEQILFDANKSMGDINIFRLAYDDKGNVAHIVDDQMTPNLEKRYPVANENIKDPTNKSRLPLFGKGSIARNLEIRTEVSSKLSNMIAISANSNYDDQSSLSKSADSFGFYNLSYTDRYIPTRTEFSSSTVELPTDSMIRSTLQFNDAIQSFYGSATPASTAVSHATNYYIQRMSKIKTSEKGTRAAAMIPVSLNFSIDGMSGFGMGQSFTVDPEFLPYTYNLSNTNPFGEQDTVHTVAFVMVGLDHTIEGNQWISNVRSNMIFAKKADDFTTGIEKLRLLEKPSGLESATAPETKYDGVAIAAKKLNFTYDQIKNAIKKKGYTWYDSDYKLNIIGVRNSSTNNLVTNKFDDILVLAYKDGSEIKYYQWAITTDPGSYYNVNFFPGTTSTGRMVPGQYINAYAVGLHRDKYDALVEVGAIKAFRDSNKNDVYDETNIQQGNFNMNIHKALASDTGVRGEINDSSAGCQVFASSQDFLAFMSIVKNSKSKLNSNSFTYTLLTSQDIA